MTAQADTVKVIVRCRPFNQKEANEGAHNVVFANKQMSQVTVNPPDYDPEHPPKDHLMGQKMPRTFTFDAVYGMESKNIDIFLESFRPVITALMEGFNACIFAYGQTGSGKTYTMSGDKNNPGCIPNAFYFLFDYIAHSQEEKKDYIYYLVQGSYIEIYNEHIRDLITNKNNLPLREHPERGVIIQDVAQYTVSNDQELLDLYEKGFNARSVAATKMNATSSRSHSIFMVRLECLEVINGKETIRVGQLNLVDLAGSERQSKTEATGDRLTEANSINLSLTTLGIVIYKLVDGSAHIPYRDSVLTRLLQNSLGGNSKTLMVANVNPASTNYDETMSTLRYADQAKKIKNKPKVNEDPKDAQIREMRDRIKLLEEQLQAAMNGGSISAENGVLLQNVMQYMNQMKAGDQEVAEEEIEEIEEVSDPEEAEKLRELREYKKQLADKLREQDESTSAAKITISDMKNQLKELKNAVISGKQLEDANRERERQLRETRIKLAEKKEKEEKLKRDIMMEEQLAEEKKKTFASAKEEADNLRAKVAKLKQEIMQIDQDITEIKQSQRTFEDDLETQMKESLKQLDLKQLLIELFVPKHEVAKAERFLLFNEQTNRFEYPSGKRLDKVLIAARGARTQYPHNNAAPICQQDAGQVVLKQEEVAKRVK